MQQVISRIAQGKYIALDGLRIEVSKPENVCSGWLPLTAEGKETR
jgi:hypothetical protein